MTHRQQHPIPLFFRDLERVDRLEWIVVLRWIAILFILSVTFSAEKIFHLSINSTIIYITTFIVAVYNIIFLICTKKIKSKYADTVELPHVSHNLAFIQGIVDVSFLTIILHYSGGIENPFIFFYIFHVIIAGLLLKGRAPFIQALFSCLLIFCLSIGEYFSLLSHYTIGGFLPSPLYNNKTYLIVINLVFCSTIIISAFIMTSINKKILKKEENLETAGLQIEKMNESLREQDRRKSEYVMMVSHNLKSPLSSIKNLIDVLTGGYTGDLSVTAQESLTRISRKVDAIMLFINDLLDLTKIKSKDISKKDSIQIVDIINTVIDEIKTDSDTKGITIKKQFEDNISELKGNGSELKNLFLNLMLNAVKYNKRNGSISITVKTTNKDIIVEITDSGIGVPREDVPHIFDEFYRAPNAKKYSYEGSGLGLSLVKYVTERHGGTVRVESSPDNGSKFIVTFQK